ncbi:MAG: LamG-like jellyroll fold domain-containing protein [Patescibacteria group bacterium]|jgi:RHS repeat-associated protein
MLSSKRLETKIKIVFTLITLLVNILPAPYVSAQELISDTSTETMQLPIDEKVKEVNRPVLEPIPLDPPVVEVKPELVPELLPVDEQQIDKPLVEEENLKTEGNGILADMYANRDNAGNQPKDKTGEYQVDEFTGAFNYNYPIQIPAGRNGLQPNISLQYNQRRTDHGSFVGFGWELILPSISRENRTGVNNIYDEHYFVLDGSQLTPVSVDTNGYGIYGKLIESDFSKIEFDSSNKWVVTDKLGTQYTYGANSTARQDDPNNSSRIYKWLLEEVRDTNDNFIRYEYYKDSGQIYPKKINYTGHGETDGIFTVNFEPFATGVPIANNVSPVSYQTGFAVQSKYLLDNIDVKIDGNLASSYVLDFSLNTKGNRYLLKNIVPKYYQGGQEDIKDKVDFNYSEQGTSYQLDVNYTAPAILGSDVALADTKRDMFIDLNNDSYTDYINMYCDHLSHTVNVNVSENNGNGGWRSSAYSTSIPFSGTCRGTLISYSIPVAFAELNGDHMIDMVATADSDNYYINTGSGWSQQSGGLPVSLYQSSSPSPMDAVIFQDMNNDGYDDLIHDHLGTQVRVYMRDPGSGGWNLDGDYNINITAYVAPACFENGGSPFGFSDLNSDNLPDIFYSYDCGIGEGYNGGAVYLNNGSALVELVGGSAPIVMNDFSYISTALQKVRYLSDIDQDGASDAGLYIRSKWNGPNNPRSSGELALLGKVIFNTGTFEDSDYFMNSLPVAIADINGDQVQDVVHSYEAEGLSYSEIYIGQGEKLDILEKINQQSGAKLQVYYDYSANEKDEGGNLKNPDLPFNMQVVKEVVLDTGLDKWQGQQYHYSEGNTVSYPDSNLKDIYGFAKVEKHLGDARPDIDLGTGIDGDFVSSGNDTWATDKNFSSLHILAGHTITVEPDVIIKVQGDALIDGVLYAKGKGYLGGLGIADGSNNGTGTGFGGGVIHTGDFIKSGGGGAGHATIGVPGGGDDGGDAGISYGFPNLDPIFMGSGGGSGDGAYYTPGGDGGDGGGIIQLFAYNIDINGEVNADGEDGIAGVIGGMNNWYYTGGGGGGSGGSIYLKAFKEANIGENLVHALGGLGGIGAGGSGGNASAGRIRIDAEIVRGNTTPEYYYNPGDVRYSIDNSTTNSDLQKNINYYHTAKDDDFYLHGKIKQIDQLDAQDNLLSKEFVTWQENDLNNGRKFVYDYEDTKIDLSGTSEQAVAIRNDYDLTNGNLNTKHDLGEVILNSSTGEIVSILTGDEKDTNYEYAVNETKHILSAPKTKVISDITNSKQQDLYYDNLLLGEVDKVNLTKEDYIEQGVEIKRNFNSLGLVTQEISPKNATTTIAYDSNNLYPVSSTDPLNNVTYTDYNILNGQIATSTAPNGAMTIKEYDNFGRLVKTKISDPNSPSALVTKQEINYYDESLVGMGDTGWVYPTQTGLHDNYFSNPSNAYAIDGSYASARVEGGQTKTQSYEGFNFSLPDNVKITGLEVFIRHRETEIENQMTILSYYSASNGRWSEAEFPNYSLGWDNKVLGGRGNLWGIMPTVTDFDFDNFSIYYSAFRVSGVGAGTWSLDAVAVKLYYQDSDDAPRFRYKETKDYFDINSYTTSREYYDGLDRVIQKKNNLANQNEFATVDISYDSQGRVASESLPYISDTIEYTLPNFDPVISEIHQELTVDNDTLALWHMNGQLNSAEKKDNAEGTVAFDLSENASPTSVSGFNQITDGAYDLERDSGQYLSVPDNDALDGFGDFTVEAWVKLESLPASGQYWGIVSKWGGAGGWDYGNSYHFGYNNVNNAKQLEFGWNDNNSPYGTSQGSYTVDLSLNSWHYIAATADLSVPEVKFYVDGVEHLATMQYTGANDLLASEADLLIGANYSDNPGYFFDGSIDEVGITTRIKTAQEISNYYNNYNIILDPNYLAKIYTYDALGRVLAETTPVGTTSYDYNGFTTKITDANGNFKELTKDAYGNLIQVKEYLDSNIYSTNYEYTLTNKLKKITDSAGNIRNFSYDALDNLEWQDMVHKTSVTNPAKIQYTYDKNGNVLTETSFKNDAISYAYDDLNRPLTEKLSSVTKINYIYDQNGDIGQLTFADYGSDSYKSYDYDILGRLKTATTTIVTEKFVMNYDYDLNGNLKEIVYPDGKVVTYGFNAMGQVDEVSLDQGQGASIVASNIQYNQNGQMTHIERANNVVTDYTYDPAQAFRLTRILSATATSTLQDLNYTYDPVGNILTLIDNANTDLQKSASYIYDDLNRLLSATVSYTNHPDKNYTQSFTYDSIGNMTSNSDLGTLNYANGQPHQLSSYGTRNFVYDTAGNMTRNGGITKFTWDYRNRLASTHDIATANNTYYKYDHNNQRFIKWTEDYVYVDPEIEQDGIKNSGRDSLSRVSLDGGAELDGVGHWEWQVIAKDEYVDKYFEKNLNSQTKSHVYLNEIKLATVNNNDNPYYLLSDHLNSSSILTDSTGTSAQLSDYKPFGSINYDNKLIDLKDDYTFTGKEADEENNLQYYGARYNDNQLGRFISLDPANLILYNSDEFKEKYNRNIGVHLSDPQNLNSYSYVVNNPLKYTDDNGEIFWVPVILSAIASSFLFGIPVAQAPGNDFNSQTARAGESRDFIGFVAPAYNNLNEPQKFGVLLVAGSIAEKSSGKIASSLVGKSFGKLGTVVANESGTITSLTREEVAKPFHGLDQAITKGVSPKTMLDTLKNPLITFKQSGDNLLYLSREAGVVLDKAGRLVTTYSKEYFKDHIKNVIKLFD